MFLFYLLFADLTFVDVPFTFKNNQGYNNKMANRNLDCQYSNLGELVIKNPFCSGFENPSPDFPSLAPRK